MIGGEMNKAILIGRCGHDPEIRESVARFSLATQEGYKTKDGQDVPPEWHKIVCFGKTADICAKYIVKGKQVAVEGRIQTRSWEAKDGTKKWATEIIASHIELLGSRGDSKPQDRQAPVDADERSVPGRDGDIPF